MVKAGGVPWACSETACPVTPGGQPRFVVGGSDAERDAAEEHAERRVGGVDDTEYGRAGGSRVAVCGARAARCQAASSRTAA